MNLTPEQLRALLEEAEAEERTGVRGAGAKLLPHDPAVAPMALEETAEAPILTPVDYAAARQRRLAEIAAKRAELESDEIAAETTNLAVLEVAEAEAPQVVAERGWNGAISHPLAVERERTRESLVRGKLIERGVSATDSIELPIG